MTTFNLPAPGTVPAPPSPPLSDPASQANLSEVQTRHLHLDWHVDWQKRVIEGSAEHTLEVVAENGAKEVVFDASFLDIKEVQIQGTKALYDLSDRHPVMGNALRVPFPDELPKGSQIKVKIEYATTSECTAIGWLENEQTAGGKHPFLYSQCQAIHARSLLPCQDSPGIKLTYTAKVKSTLPVLLSALRQSPPPNEVLPEEKLGKEDVEYVFEQPVPIPSYLIAIAAGDVTYKSMGRRTGVWAEKPMLEKSWWEFVEDAERFLDAAESIVTPYEWGKYDVLVLPPSFPYGGMENANLTTLTPTLLAGDRSLTDVVAHELAHSWMGNGTGTRDWVHFWLNEGWCVYLERLILQKLHGPAERGFAYLIGRNALQDTLRHFEKKQPRFQRLVIDYEKGEDPDDAFSSVPYEKGSNFLLHLERTVGGLEIFLPFVKSYLITFHRRAISTEEFKQHLFDFYAQCPDITERLCKDVDWNAWLYGEGTELPVKMEYDDTLARAAWSLAERWDALRNAGPGEVEKAGFSKEDLKEFTANQVILFLERVHSLPKLPDEVVLHLGKVYELGESTNDEIRLRWFEVSLFGGEASKAAQEVKAGAAEWVKDKGRMKYCRAVYRELFKVDKELARRTFKENADFYHPIARRMIEKDLELA